jgi:HPt (histidine-containing phosphotransfer) domain-containing protein
MAQPATKSSEPAPALAPGASAIDRRHLARMTFGDRSLERELLQLFTRQATLLISRMREGEPAAIAGLAHTLKGSAAGIGAGSVAAAAQAVELAAGTDALECQIAIERLSVALEEACAVIGEVLAAH